MKLKLKPMLIFIVLAVITVLTIISTITQDTAAKYVIQKQAVLTVKTANFHFNAEAEDDTLTFADEITTNLIMNNYDGEDITTTDIEYTITTENTRYDLTLDLGEAEALLLEPGEEEPEEDEQTVGITLTPKAGTVVTEDETVIIEVTTTKPFVETIEIELTIQPKVVEVTLDYNDGVTSNTTQNATYGLAYGTLPEPTREGYTFDGWNGKNLFDKSKYLNIEDFYTFHSSTQFYSAEINLKPNTTYFINIIYKNGFDGRNNDYLLISDYDIINANWTSIAHPSAGKWSDQAHFIYQTGNDGKLYIGRYHSTTQANLDTIWANTDVQIEEGTSATAYEPYYVTSSTTVTQMQDHTLTAMWTPNTYTVSFDHNEGIEFEQTGTTLTNFNGSTSYTLQIGKMSIEQFELNDKVLFEADIDYEDLTADTSMNYRALIQCRGNITAWDSVSYQTRKYIFLGTGTDTISWEWTFNDLSFSTNDEYRFQLRTDYYTGGSITISNIRIRKVNTDENKTVTYDSAYGTLLEPTRTYTTTYNYNGATSGNETASATTNYTFVNWYRESTFENVITRDSVVTTASNHNLYAKWTAGETRLPSPAKTGYTFNGWYEESDFSGTPYAANTMYTPVSSGNMYAKWTINSYNLTINPNGGTFNSSTSNTTITQNYDTMYGLQDPTRDGYTFTGWTLTNNGTLLRGNASGNANSYWSGFEEEIITDTDGSKYTNYSYEDLYAESIIYPAMYYPNYSFVVGHTYRISFDFRLNTYTNVNYLEIRHACRNNDYSSYRRTFINVNSSYVGKGWQTLNLERTYENSTITYDGEERPVNPLFEIFTRINEENTASLDFDIRNVIIEDITAGTCISTSTYGGYIYKFGEGAGTLTANWTPNTYTVTLNNQSATTAGTASVQATMDASLPDITVPTKTGYTFGGYYSNTDAFDMTVNKVTADGNVRLNIREGNGWNFSSEDAGTHIQGKIIIANTDLSHVPSLDFNDVFFTPYKTEQNENELIIYIDFIITEEMITNRGGNNYGNYWRFIDIGSSTSTVTVEYLVKGGKKYYDADGYGVFPSDFTSASTIYAKWTPNEYTITFEYTEEKNYANVSPYIEKTSFNGGENQIIWMGYFYMDDLEEGDIINYSYKLAYENLTYDSSKEYRIRLQGRGDVSNYGDGAFWGDWCSPEGTGEIEYYINVIIDNNVARNTSFNEHLKISYYTGGKIIIKDFKITKVNTETQSKYCGDALGTLPTPTRTGYTFIGWYTEPTGGTKISSSTTVPAGDTTYYAHWGKTLAQAVAAGDIQEGDTVLYDATNNTIAPYTPTLAETGYSGTNGTFSTTDSIVWNVFNVDTVNGTVDIVGQTPNSLTLSGGTGFVEGINTLNKVSQVYGYGKGAIAARSLTREDLEGKTTNNFGKASFANPNANEGAHAGYYLGQRTYTSGNFYKEINDNGTITYENTLTDASVTPVTMTQTYYCKSNAASDFTNSDLKDVMIGIDDNYKDYWLSTRTVLLSNSYSIFGIAIVKNCKVDHDNLMHSDITMRERTHKVSPLITLSSSTVIEKDGNNWNVVDGPQAYKIEYDLAGGSVATDNPVQYNAETATFTLNNPTKEGYTFAGWTGTNGNTPEMSVTIPLGSTGNKTYTANWIITVALNNQNATTAGTTSVQATMDEFLPDITVPTKTGYTFGGYYSNTEAFDMTLIPATMGNGSYKRVYFSGTDNGWNMTTADVGKHIQGKIIIESSIKPTIQMNDIDFLPYKTEQSGNNWIYYIDLDITEEMLEARAWNYDTKERFIDIVTTAPVTVEYITIGGKKYYDADGHGVFPSDFTQNATLYAKWKENEK